MRLALLVVVVACAAHDGTPPPAKHAMTAAPAPVVAPGLRLPEGVAPLAYDLTLEVDPEQAEFRGHVEIRVHLTAPTDHVWLHADELDLTQASYRDGNTSGRLAVLPVAGDEMRAFGFGRVIDDHEITLAFDYTGHTLHDEEGLFRQREAGRWYVFSQSESVFARRILPCFDEPRFKVPWKVTLVVPPDQVALANAPQLAAHLRSDGRREVTFAETPPMASYLLAIAVGPFELVDVGKLGKGKLPVRVAA
ncbi:MAG: M1 family peptidase, partial [Acidobacteriota bacterium]